MQPLALPATLDKLKKLAKDKHASLFCFTISDEEKKSFMRLTPDEPTQN
jgi:hypothetical protein